MKTVIKSMSEPANLTRFRTDNPDGTWENMRKDALTYGRETVHDIYSQTIQDQKGLCAYCECRISAKDSLHRQIEHFHPKSDLIQSKNWALDWKNMLAVCVGGERQKNKSKDTYQLPKNLSCGASKKDAVYDGLILNPLSLPPFPSLFTINKGTGELKPEEKACSAVTMQDNRYGTTKELVENTIEQLNLNCDRLRDLRLEVVKLIEEQKARYREKGIGPKEALLGLAKHYFSQNLPDWPEFFTTIRYCLGQAAEEYLHSIQYQG